MFDDQVGYHIRLSVSGSIMNGSHSIMVLNKMIQLFFAYKMTVACFITLLLLLPVGRLDTHRSVYQ